MKEMKKLIQMKLAGKAKMKETATKKKRERGKLLKMCFSQNHKDKKMKI